jgi:hypothetical protein
MNNGFFTWWRRYSYDNISLNSSYKEKRFKHTLYGKSNNTFFVQLFPENRAAYEIMWTNTIQQDWPQIAIMIRRMRVACWVTKPKNIHLLLFHVNNGYANAPQCYVYTYIACLISVHSLMMALPYVETRSWFLDLNILLCLTDKCCV